MVSKSIIFLVNSFLGNFYGKFAIFSGHTDCFTTLVPDRKLFLGQPQPLFRFSQFHDKFQMNIVHLDSNLRLQDGRYRSVHWAADPSHPIDHDLFEWKSKLQI